MKTCYSIAKPGMVNLVKGVFTNKKLLFDAINDVAIKKSAEISFIGTFNYENKKFNYSNMNKLLNSILVNEGFSLQIKSPTGSISNIEITLQQVNKFNSN